MKQISAIAMLLMLTATPASADSEKDILLIKDAEQAFTIFPQFSMNLEHVISVTYGFITEKKDRSDEDEGSIEVKVKLVTKKSDGSTTDLPYPNYPHSKEYSIACAPNSTPWVEPIDGEEGSKVAPEDIETRMGPHFANPASFYYDLYWAVCTKQNRVFTDAFYKEFTKN